MKSFKNDVILFLVMLAIGLIGFNIVGEYFSDAAASDTSLATRDVGDDLLAPALNVSNSSRSTEGSDTSHVGEVGDLQVKTMLKNRVDAWNARNLVRYMADYRKFDSLRVSVNGETAKGWEEVSDFFEPRFGPGMGTLRISNMKIHMVGDFAAIVSADWNLQQENRITNGRMNLVMKKVDAIWKITTENLTER